MEDTERIIFEEVNDGFVVLEADIMGELSETLSHELVLLFFEDVGDVKLLQFFVGEVDEELLKRVDIEDLKPENIQKSDTFSIIVGVFLVFEVDLLDFYFFVHFLDEVGEGFFVDVFGEGVSEGDGFLVLERGVDHIESHLSGFEVERVLKFIIGHI